MPERNERAERATFREENGVGYLRASSLNKCRRALAEEVVLGRVAPVSAAMAAAAEAGQALEPLILSDYQQETGFVLAPQVECELPLTTYGDGKELVVEGTTDAVAHNQAGEPSHIVEVKTVGGVLPSQGEAFSRWGRQITAYGLALSLPVRLVVVARESGESVEYEFKDFSIVDLVDHLVPVIKAIEVGSVQHVPCDCGHCITRETVDATPDVAEAVVRLGVIRETIEELEKEEAALKEFLLTSREWGPDEAIEVDRWRLVWVPEGTQSRFDSRLHAKEVPDCHASYMREVRRAAYLRLTRRQS